MNSRTFEAETFIARPRDEVFEFFSRADNLEKITPSSLKFRIITPLPVEMKVGAIIEYKLRINGIPIHWKTEIARWEPPRLFQDIQVRGPYKIWEHTHSFEETDGGTRMMDQVAYLSKGGPLAPIIHKLFVDREVEKIFQFRNQAISEKFESALS